MQSQRTKSYFGNYILIRKIGTRFLSNQAIKNDSY